MSVIVPLLVGVNLYQMVFGDPTTHVGIGSVVWVVAPELSFVSVKEPLANVMLIAFAKLSFVGAGATTKKGERKPVAGCGRDAHRNLWRSRSTDERGRNGGGQLGISTRSGRNRRTVPFDRSPGQPASIDREGKLGGTSQRRNRRNRRNMGADKRKIVQHNVPRPAPMSGSAKCSRCAMQLERKYGCSRQARA